MKNRILVVDDEKDICFSLKEYFEKFGNFEVEACYNGLDGLKKAKEFKPDVILLDIMMPEMDGPEMACTLRQDKEIKDIPLVFLTSLVSKEELSKQKHITEPYYMMAKPVELDKIMKLVNKIVSKKPQ